MAKCLTGVPVAITVLVCFAEVAAVQDLLPRGECGNVILKRARVKRILGGNSTDFGEYPWQAALVGENNSEEKKIYCSGTLIDHRWIVTAAHCLSHTVVPSEIRVVLGEHDVFSSNNVYKRVERRGLKLIRHPSYSYQTLLYDVALIKLDKPVEYDKHIQPICLPTSESKDLNKKFVVATGWGRIFEKGKRSGILQEVPLPVIDNKVCEKVLLQGNVKTSVDKALLCVGYKNGKRSFCQGDSGGPLQYETPDGHWEIVGIISSTYGCGRRYKPGLATRISTVKEWIIEELNKNSRDL